MDACRTPSPWRMAQARAAHYPPSCVLTMEPLLSRLRDNPDIKGLDIGDKHCKMAAYADDILLFLTDPINTISNLLQDFALFKTISNLQINFSTSKALNVSLSSRMVTQCQNNFPFSWEPQALTYLGVKIPTPLRTIF